ncbi:A24 family peptidase [Chengkuizengella sediminis]|uniref:A24 family peptidase n=1 Tax=Chengkuizengella sediminis TaxID=1885917 RepID=UPI0023F2B919|nr:A24 family peptidase [Chengkuizengella sediminis]NDI35576.1 prepilin peptidase [Chengkuizengella sediminis]
MIFILLAFLTDITTHKIPNVITMTAIVTGWFYHIIKNGFNGLWFSLIGLFVVMLLMVLLYSIRAVAAGDVKLFGAIGAWTGLKVSLYILMYSILFSALIGMCILLFKKENWSRIKAVHLNIFNIFIYRDIKLLKAFANDNLQFPFMIAVLPGVVAAYFHLFLLKGVI